MTTSGLQLNNVSVLYGSEAALHSISISIAPGEAVALVGPSGSGKTTLLGLINGTVRPTSGSVVVDGYHLGQLSPDELRDMRSHIGYIHQQLGLVPNLQVLQNVLAGRLGSMSLLSSIRAMFSPRPGDALQVHALLERVGIPEKLYERTDRLSGGQQQRVAIARALHQKPMILLADEPVSSVDPARAHDTIKLLTEISREKGITLCVSLHNLELAQEFFPRLVGLRLGRLIFDAPTPEVDPQTFARLYQLEPSDRSAGGQ